MSNKLSHPVGANLIFTPYCYRITLILTTIRRAPVGGVSEIPKVFFLDAFLHFFTPLENLERSPMLGAPLHLLTEP